MPELNNLRYEQFARAYIAAGGRTEVAAAEVGYSAKYGHRLLSFPEVAGRIAELRAAEQTSFSLSREDIINRWTKAAVADPRELVQHRIGSCRHCWGIGHEYQWRTRKEWRLAWLKWAEEARIAAKEKIENDAKAAALVQLIDVEDIEGLDALDDPRIPTSAGGFGYSLPREPNPDCPECNGLGIPFVVAADTSKLTAAQAALYAGAKHTAHGIEILFKDQAKPLEHLAREKGLMKGDDPNAGVATDLAALLASVADRAAAMPNRTGRKPKAAEGDE